MVKYVVVVAQGGLIVGVIFFVNKSLAIKEANLQMTMCDLETDDVKIFDLTGRVVWKPKQ